MRVHIMIPLGALLIQSFGLGVPSVHAQVDQRDLERKLNDADATTRFSAVAAVQTMGPEKAGEALRGALIAALAREGELHAAFDRGQGARPENPEILARMAQVVGVFEDPRAIGPLAGALGTGSAIRPLAAFGEPAVAAVLELAASVENVPALQDALITLRFLAEGVGQAPITPATRERMIDLARQRLSPEQSLTVFWRAIDLAIALDDPDLRRLVMRIAADPDEIAARIVSSIPDAVERTRRRAEARLAGELPLPRW